MFCLCVCWQDYCKSNQPFLLKLGLLIERTSELLMMMRSLIWNLDRFFTSLTIAEYGILGDLLTFLI